jgi:hypothetical protein
MCEIWIAAHFNQANDPYWLTNCIKSCLKQTIPPSKIRISLSSDIAEHFNYDDPLVAIYHQEKRMYQFDHLRFIYNISLKDDLKDDTWILLVDHDDMLISNAIESVVNLKGDMAVGFQYIGIDSRNDNVLNGQDVLKVEGIWY